MSNDTRRPETSNPEACSPQQQHTSPGQNANNFVKTYSQPSENMPVNSVANTNPDSAIVTPAEPSPLLTSQQAPTHNVNPVIDPNAGNIPYGKNVTNEVKDIHRNQIEHFRMSSGFRKQAGIAKSNKKWKKNLSSAGLKQFLQPKNALTILNELYLKPVYTVKEICRSPKNIPVFLVVLSLNGQTYTAESTSVADAKQIAADLALKKLFFNHFKQINTHGVPRIQPAPGAESVPKTESNIKTEPDIKIEPGTKLDIKIEPGTKPAIKIEPGTKPAIKIEPGTESDIKIEPGTEPDVNVEPGTEPDIKIEPVLRTEPAPWWALGSYAVHLLFSRWNEMDRSAGMPSADQNNDWRVGSDSGSVPQFTKTVMAPQNFPWVAIKPKIVNQLVDYIAPGTPKFPPMKERKQPMYVFNFAFPKVPLVEHIDDTNLCERCLLMCKINGVVYVGKASSRKKAMKLMAIQVLKNYGLEYPQYT